MADYSDQGAPYNPPPPPSGGGGKVILWIVVILLVLGLLGVVACCGCPAAIAMFGIGVMKEQVKSQVQGKAAVQEHIGEISKIDVNFMAAGQHGQGRDNVLAFDVKGDKGSGLLVVQTIPESNNALREATLILPDGREFNLLE